MRSIQNSIRDWILFLLLKRGLDVNMLCSEIAGRYVRIELAPKTSTKEYSVLNDYSSNFAFLLRGLWDLVDSPILSSHDSFPFLLFQKVHQ